MAPWNSHTSHHQPRLGHDRPNSPPPGLSTPSRCTGRATPPFEGAGHNSLAIGATHPSRASSNARTVGRPASGGRGSRAPPTLTGDSAPAQSDNASPIIRSPDESSVSSKCRSSRLAASPRAIASASRGRQWASLGDRPHIGLLVKGGSVGRARLSVVAIANRRLPRADQRASCSRQSRAANATRDAPGSNRALSRDLAVAPVGNGRRFKPSTGPHLSFRSSGRHGHRIPTTADAMGLSAEWCGSNERMARVDDQT